MARLSDRGKAGNSQLVPQLFRSPNRSLSRKLGSVNVGEFRVRIIRFLPHHEKTVSFRSDPGPILIQRIGGDGHAVRADYDAVAANQGAIDFGIAESRRRAAVISPRDEIIAPVRGQAVAAT